MKMGDLSAGACVLVAELAAWFQFAGSAGARWEPRALQGVTPRGGGAGPAATLWGWWQHPVLSPSPGCGRVLVGTSPRSHPTDSGAAPHAGLKPGGAIGGTRGGTGLRAQEACALGGFVGLSRRFRFSATPNSFVGVAHGAASSLIGGLTNNIAPLHG